MRKIRLRWAILAVCSIVIIASPRILRIWEYLRFINRLEAKPALSSTVAKVECDGSFAGTAPIALGCATLRVADSVESVHHNKGVITIDCNKIKYLLMVPFDEPSEMLDRFGIQFYDGLVEIARSRPKALFEIVLMSDEAYTRHVQNIALKCSDDMRENGVELYENDEIRAMIFLGCKTDPNRLLCFIIHRKTGIAQGVYIQSSDSSNSIALEKYACALIKSYNINITQLPDRERLNTIIGTSVDLLNERQGHHDK
jgi:hypothetical protein